MPLPHSPSQNHILNTLPAAELAQLFPHLELVSMPLGFVLYECGCAMRHGYFPTTAIVSQLYVTASGATAEVAMVGKEGMVGVPLLMGGEATTNRAIVQSAGHAYRLKAQLLKQAFDGVGELPHVLLLYAQALLTQMAMTAACYRHHSLEQQVCRYLLLSLDRACSNELVMTQELMASMIGVRREGVTDAAGQLQKAGLIEYRRGHITVIDRVGLEARSCECYAVQRKEFQRLLPSADGTKVRSGHDRPDSLAQRHPRERRQMESVCC